MEAIFEKIQELIISLFSLEYKYFFTAYFWSDLYNVIKLYIHSFVLAPIVYSYVFFMTSSTDKKRGDKSLQAAVLFSTVFMPALLFIITLLVSCSGRVSGIFSY